MDYIVTFHTHFDALRYEKFLKSRNIEGQLRPVPRTLSSSCGTCVRFTMNGEIDKNSIFVKMEFDKIFVKICLEYMMIVEHDEL